MCAVCVEAVHDFEPDMGDGIDFAPGQCGRCGKADVIVFDIASVE